MIRDFQGVRPQIHPTAFIDETALLIGRVKVGPQASVWPYAVLRGDIEEIVVGEGTNIQDHTVIHTDHGVPTVLGSWISVGHRATLHSCRVEDGALIGMGSLVLTDAVVEQGAMVGAGALVAPRGRVSAGHLALGVPARVLRPLRPEEIQHLRENARHYVEYAQSHRTSSRGVNR